MHHTIHIRIKFNGVQISSFIPGAAIILSIKSHHVLGFYQ